MNMDELWSEVGRRVREAYAVRPGSYGGLPQEYESGDWRQVIGWMHYQRARFRDDSSPKFLHKLSEAESALATYNSEGMRSVLDGLNAREKRVIGECLRAVAYGPFFRKDPCYSVLGDVSWDSDFEIVFGMTGEEVARVSDLWPDVEASDPDLYAAISGSINNLLGYPHKKHHLWSQHISASHYEVREIHAWFRQLAGRNRNRPRATSFGHEYFLNLVT